ncbi:MAG: ornithine carbamoyltransferase [Candidatus Lokiarchaeota archaeon]|nr:ornithine carbamoyltransferase [Candidatus Lokiarchaeota archaeon]MBD3202187.1 ornithine carbamoyltransferase [Candidatus Lokiarchaeota archaeon]
MKRNLLKITDLTKKECESIINKAIDIKKHPEKYFSSLKKETLLMFFEKPSLRTRISFETGMFELGGQAIFYSIKDSPLGKKESIEDMARVVSRYANVLAARVFDRNDIWSLAKYASIPVINMLDDFAHPCQIMSDFMTIKEKKGKINDLKLSFFGDGHNNVTYDLMRAAALYGLKMDVACPKGKEYSPEEIVLEEIKVLSEKSNAKIRVLDDAKIAAKDSDVIYTDSWMSYGIPFDKEEVRKKMFLPFQVNEEIIENAKSDAIFMNCLPAMRGYEQTAEVIDGEHSIVFDQAENRLHAQKAILLFLRDKF